MHPAIFGPVKKLHIVDDQHIDELVEMNKVVDGIVAAMVDKLVDKFFGAYVQNHFAGLASLYFVADGLCQVRFTQAHAAIDHERIE